MNKPVIARCGLLCDECKYREQFNCPGCEQAQGKMFWGECRVAKCCMEKEHANCGECAEFDCDLLREFSYDKEQGDNGRRITNLKKLRQ